MSNNDVNYVDKLIDVAKSLNYNVKFDNEYGNGYIYVEIKNAKGNPFELTLVDYTKAYEGEYTYRQAAELLIDDLREQCVEFDVSAETYNRLGENGHGLEGEPYDMKDVYEGVVSIGNNMDYLMKCLYDAYYNDCFERYTKRNENKPKHTNKKNDLELF